MSMNIENRFKFRTRFQRDLLRKGKTRRRKVYVVRDYHSILNSPDILYYRENDSSSVSFSGNRESCRYKIVEHFVNNPADKFSVDGLSSFLNFSRDLVDKEIDWLLKHGYLRSCSGRYCKFYYLSFI